MGVLICVSVCIPLVYIDPTRSRSRTDTPNTTHIVMASAYSFENYDTYTHTQVCASTPQTTANTGMHNFVTYNTNVADRRYHDMEHFQFQDMAIVEDKDREAEAAEREACGACVQQDEDELFQIEDVDACDYIHNHIHSTCAAGPVVPSSRIVTGSLPSLMLDASSDEESEEEAEDDHDDDHAVDCSIIASAAADEDVGTWNTGIISPYLHPRNVSSSSNFVAKKQQLTFDSILSHTQHSASTFTSVAADNYNLWLSSH